MQYTSLALAGLPGSGKSVLCTALSKKLNWPVHTIGDLFRKRYEKWKELKDNFISFEDYWANYVTADEIYQVNEEARKILERGNVILDSRYASLNALNLNTCLRVFLTAPLNIRAQRNFWSVKYDCKDPDSIALILQQRENDERQRGNVLFGAFFEGDYDYTDKKHYDLVIDSGVLSVDEEVSQILKLIK